MIEGACKAVLISRQMGSGGSYIGQLVAQDLGFRYIDRVILHEATRRLVTDEEYLAGRGGRAVEPSGEDSRRLCFRGIFSLRASSGSSGV